MFRSNHGNIPFGGWDMETRPDPTDKHTILLEKLLRFG